MSEYWEVEDALDAALDQAKKVHSAVIEFKGNNPDPDLELAYEGDRLLALCRGQLKLTIEARAVFNKYIE